MKQKKDQKRIQPKLSSRGKPAKTPTPLTLNTIQTKLDTPTLLQMQRELGNQAVQRFLVQRLAGEESFVVEDELSSQIQSKVGSGSTVGDTSVAQNVSTLTGVDVTDAKMQMDSDLPAQVGAKAMAVGDTVFVGSGHDSAETVGHELAHVAQNKTGNAPALQASGLTVTAANTSYEEYADSVGAMATQSSSQMEQAAQAEQFSLQRTGEEEEIALQREGLDEEEMVLQREELDEEEMALQREELDEEEMALQREELLDEEEMALQREDLDEEAMLE